MNTTSYDHANGSQSDGDIFRSAAPVSRDSSREVPQTPGQIPALPESEAELESYAELYHYPADIFNG